MDKIAKILELATLLQEFEENIKEEMAYSKAKEIRKICQELKKTAQDLRNEVNELRKKK